MVTIIDYGIGNLRSIEKAFEAVGVEAVRTDEPAVLARAERLVLPGVGAFGACAAEIRRRGLEAPIREAVAAGKPFLGVCVGMQLLFDASEELGLHAGLGILPGRVVRFQGHAAAGDAAACGAVDAPETNTPGTEAHAVTPVAAAEAKALKVPHMGWNTLHLRQPAPLLEGLGPEPFFYFVHSYHAAPDEPADVLAETTYGVRFPAVVGRNNVFGVQFHPEKSQQNGLRILRNFSEMAL